MQADIQFEFSDVKADPDAGAGCALEVVHTQCELKVSGTSKSYYLHGGRGGRGTGHQQVLRPIWWAGWEGGQGMRKSYYLLVGRVGEGTGHEEVLLPAWWAGGGVQVLQGTCRV